MVTVEALHPEGLGYAIFWSKYFITICYEKLKQILFSGRDNLDWPCVCGFQLVHHYRYFPCTEMIM